MDNKSFVKDESDVAKIAFTDASHFSHNYRHPKVRKDINAVRFDLAIGFLHELDESKEPLVYDLQELFRWLVDLSVIQLIEEKKLEKSDFIVTENYHIRLKEQALTIKRNDNLEIQQRILAMTPAERKRLGINKSTGGRLSDVQGYLVYAFKVANYDAGTYKVVNVDAGNGSILYTSQDMTLQNGGLGCVGGHHFGGYGGSGMNWGGNKGSPSSSSSSSSDSSSSTQVTSA